MTLIEVIFLQYCSGTNFGAIDLLIYVWHLLRAYSDSELLIIETFC